MSNPNPALSVLQPLLGSWTMRITWSEKLHTLVGGPKTIESPVRFKWAASSSFLLQTAGGNDAPAARWMIGRDDASGAFSALYADDRGVSRVYEMSFAGGLWKIWRAAPGFHQRFEGRISPDGRMIEGCWEKSEDGTGWEREAGIRIATRFFAIRPLLP
jgi:hypothetical protein